MEWANGGDISGCHVVGDKPIFVQSGAKYSSVGTFEWPDHLANVLPTVDKLGIKYFVVPFMRQTIGDVIKFIGK